MEINLKDLAKFLVKAKKATYAGNGDERTNPFGIKSLQYKENEWLYQDTYCGFYFGLGNEVVALSNNPIWAMSYRWELPSGVNESEAKKIFLFLRESLSKVEEKYPFRGPVEGSLDHRKKYRYFIDLIPRPSNLPSLENLISFRGIERIKDKVNRPFYYGEFFGGLIKSK